MKSIIAVYDAKLRQRAQRPPAQRVLAFQAIFAPWATSSVLGAVAIRSLGGSLWLFLFPALLLLCGAFAGARFNRYGWEFDRSPPVAPWTKTESGKALITALSLVSLNSLAAVTLETKLRDDLKLTTDDLAELLTLLGTECGRDLAVHRPAGTEGLTVGELFERMQTQEATGSRQTFGTSIEVGG